VREQKILITAKGKCTNMTGQNLSKIYIKSLGLSHKPSYKVAVDGILVNFA